MNAKDERMSVDLADLFKQFADPTRIKILTMLCGGEKCVLDICKYLNMTQSAVSHQLSMLKAGSLVRARREGKQIFYSLDDDHVRVILSCGLEHVNE